MTLQELADALKEACADSYSGGHYDIDNLPEIFYSRLEVVEEGDWIQEGKYQYQSTIVKDDEGNHFEISNNRSGSYHTDWYYGDANVCQVKPVVETYTKVVWKAV